MSMTTYARDDQPVREPDDPRRAAMARRTVSKVPVVAALPGQIDPPQLVHRSLRPGLIFLAAGLFVLYFSGGAGGN
jgi:hypothetical protein